MLELCEIANRMTGTRRKDVSDLLVVKMVDF